MEPSSARAGLLDTCVLIDLDAVIAVGQLPDEAAICSITLAELAYGVATARTPVDAVRRAAVQARVQMMFDPLPFDERAALCYGELVALVLQAGRHPRPRRIDLMIAAVAVANSIPLYTANVDDFVGLGAPLDVVAIDSPSR